MPRMKEKRTSVRPTIVKLTHFYIMSEDVDRSILGFGECRKGAWLEVPPRVYNSIKIALDSGSGAGWRIKTETVNLEA